MRYFRGASVLYAKLIAVRFAIVSLWRLTNLSMQHLQNCETVDISQVKFTFVTSTKHVT